MFENTLEIVEYPSKGGSKYTEVTELERVLDQIQDSAPFWSGGLQQKSGQKNDQCTRNKECAKW